MYSCYRTHDLTRRHFRFDDVIGTSIHVFKLQEHDVIMRKCVQLLISLWLIKSNRSCYIENDDYSIFHHSKIPHATRAPIQTIWYTSGWETYKMKILQQDNFHWIIISTSYIGVQHQKHLREWLHGWCSSIQHRAKKGGHAPAWHVLLPSFSSIDY